MVEVTPIDTDTARTSLELAAQLPVGSEIRVTVIIGKPGRGLVGFRLPVSATVSDDFRIRIQSHLRRTLDSELVHYSAGRELLDGESSFRPTSAIPQASELLEILGRWLDLQFFDPTAAIGHKPNFYVVSIRERSTNDWTHFLRKLTAQYRLARSRLVAVVFRDGVYDRFTDEPLLLSDEFDAIMNLEVTIVSNQRQLDAALGLVEEARAAARKSLGEVTADLRFSNYLDFEEAVVGDLNMLSKLRSIAELRTDPAFRAAMTMEKIVAFARRNLQLGIELKGPRGAEEFVFHPDPQRRWKLLRLLDDQFVRSVITDVEYEANSKSRLR